jgi:hypothetical protein
MHRQPDRGAVGLGALDTVSDMSGDFDPVAGDELETAAVLLEAQSRGAGQQDHEFVVRLVVPEPFRA